MTDLAVLVPVLNRPHRVRPVLESIEATVEARIVFICDPHDKPEREAVEEAGGEMFLVDGGYAAKINEGVKGTTALTVFVAADDLEFCEGWFEAAKAKLTEGFEVVGVNDLISRPRRHATHFLVTRGYAQQGQIDGESGLLHEGYSHWWVDDELIATATARGVYVYAEDSHVRHLHPMTGSAPDDETYRKGRERRRHDLRLFQQRSPLWT